MARTLSAIDPLIHLPQPAVPLLGADALLAKGPHGIVFGPVSLAVASGEALAIVGDGGSGRTSLLLALAGRLRLAGGHVSLDGHPDDLQAVRRAVAVARAGQLTDLDELWTIGEAIAHRVVLASDRHAVRAAVQSRLTAFGLDLDPAARMYTLGPLQLTLFSVALSAAEDRPVLVVDDVDRGLSGAEESQVWRVLKKLAAEGRAVVGATTDTRAAREAGVRVLDLSEVSS